MSSQHEESAAHSDEPRDAPPYVAVIGPGRATTDEAAAAERVGALLAQRGAVVVCGGLGGVMEAVCKGAVRHGGQAIGILPGRDRAAGNRYASALITTGIGEARNALVVGAGDAVIAIGGSWGTLSEIGLALRTGKPAFALHSWQIDRPGRELGAGPVEVASAEEAVAAVFDALRPGPRAGRA